MTPAVFLAPAIILQNVARGGRLAFGSLLIFRRLEKAVDAVVLTWVLAQRRTRNNVRQPTTAGKSKRYGLPLSFSVQLITHMLKCLKKITMINETRVLIVLCLLLIYKISLLHKTTQQQQHHENNTHRFRYRTSFPYYHRQIIYYIFCSSPFLNLFLLMTVISAHNITSVKWLKYISQSRPLSAGGLLYLSRGNSSINLNWF